MELNRETAMRLWTKYFGNHAKARDFSGREIAKGAYNDRNSKFGWNVDHIQPQSLGGVTADYNLVCCHIQTNDEKADKFPCFRANGIVFEIVRVQNHYEIREKDKDKEPDSRQTVSDRTDFYDSASGIRLFNSLKKRQSEQRFVGTVFIYLNYLQDHKISAIIDFIEEIYNSENITCFSCDSSNVSPLSFTAEINRMKMAAGIPVLCNICITVQNPDMPNKSDIGNLLDKCVLLNTYLSSYFCKKGFLSGFDIYYHVDCLQQRSDFWFKKSTVKEPRTQTAPCRNSLYINGLVQTNAWIENRPCESSDTNSYTEYNYVFTNLQKHLEKEVSGK